MRVWLPGPAMVCPPFAGKAVRLGDYGFMCRAALYSTPPARNDCDIRARDHSWCGSGKRNDCLDLDLCPFGQRADLIAGSGWKRISEEGCVYLVDVSEPGKVREQDGRLDRLLDARSRRFRDRRNVFQALFRLFDRIVRNELSGGRIDRSCPETKSRSPTLIACENGPIAPGASDVVIASINDASILSCVE